MFQCNANHVSHQRITVNSKEKVWRSEMEKMQCVRLKHLSVMHEAAHFFAGGSEAVACSCTNNYVEGFGCREMVTNRANSAKPLNKHRGFPVWPALYKSFETAESDNVKTGLPHISFVVEMNGNLTMAFNPGYRFYCYFLSHCIIFKINRISQLHKVI
jgi:hypothetical protein